MQSLSCAILILAASRTRDGEDALVVGRVDESGRRRTQLGLERPDLHGVAALAGRDVETGHGATLCQYAVSRAVDPGGGAPRGTESQAWGSLATPSTRCAPASGSAVARACTRSTPRPAGSRAGSRRPPVTTDRSTSTSRSRASWSSPWSDSRPATSSTTASCAVAWTHGAIPTIVGRVTSISASGPHPRYAVTGDISFHGKTRTFEHEMHIDVRRGGDLAHGRRTSSTSAKFGMKPPSMLMVRVYPEISVRVELLGTRDE